MEKFDDTFFKTPEDFEKAVQKAKAILKAGGMDDKNIAKTVRNDELVYSILHQPEVVLTWNERHPKDPLNTSIGRSNLAWYFLSG